MNLLVLLLCLCCLLPATAAPTASDDAWPEQVAIVSDIFLGVQGESIAPSPYRPSARSGLVATYVVPGSPAARAGIRSGDVLLSLNGYPLREPLDLLLSLRDVRPQQSVEIALEQGSGERRVKATVVARPQPVVVAVAHRRDSALARKLEQIQVHQIDLARLFCATPPSLERLHAKFDQLEQLTDCEPGRTALHLTYDNVTVKRIGHRFIFDWYELDKEGPEMLAENGDTLAPDLQEFLRGIVARHPRINGLSTELQWLVTTTPTEEEMQEYEEEEEEAEQE